jgi:hypothetical protein
MAAMTIERLHDLFDENSEKDSLMWQGTCHDCQSDVTVEATLEKDGIHIKGGGVYEIETDKFMMKCDRCYGKDSVLRNYQECEVYSRVVGYLRPVNQWNDGKSAEFNDRKMFDASIR